MKTYILCCLIAIGRTSTRKDFAQSPKNIKDSWTKVDMTKTVPAARMIVKRKCETANRVMTPFASDRPKRRDRSAGRPRSERADQPAMHVNHRWCRRESRPNGDLRFMPTRRSPPQSLQQASGPSGKSNAFS